MNTTTTTTGTVTETYEPYDVGVIVGRFTTEDGRELRAVIVEDIDASEPEADGGTPVFHIDGERVEHVYGTGYAPGHCENLAEALRTLLARYGEWEALNLFSRYVVAFHGGSVDIRRGGWLEYSHVAVSTRTLADAWGISADDDVPTAEMGEYGAWLAGDSWGVGVEERLVTTETRTRREPGSLVVREETETVEEEWVEVDFMSWGYHGEEWAIQAARGELAYWAR